MENDHQNYLKIQCKSPPLFIAWNCLFYGWARRTPAHFSQDRRVIKEGEEENFLWQVRMLPLALALLLMINVSVRPSELSPRSDKLILGRQWLSLGTFSVAKEIPFNSRTFTFDISTSVYTRGTIYPDIFHSNTLFHYKCIMFFPFLCMKNNDLKSNISIYRKF